MSFRINPDVDARTHAKISTGKKENKFGIPIARASEVYAEAARLPGLQVIGIDVHIGSQLTKTSPFSDAIARLCELILSLAAEGIWDVPKVMKYFSGPPNYWSAADIQSNVLMPDKVGEHAFGFCGVGENEWVFTHSNRKVAVRDKHDIKFNLGKDASKWNVPLDHVR